MNICEICREPIRRDSHYVAVDRHVETVGRFGRITVKDAELAAAYHLDCAPPSISQIRAALLGKRTADS
jgi:hypothetical protein